ncbi:mannitol dehydrogenase family protein [Arthrobacter sp. zg-Y238]|uniref:mannitol dehydrogenase family protein n=1 Tax=Arthrobacter sp. zg-Y238 TaxID=2964614 RepID=UPI002105F0E5|nr:mannitol dehydrogenase family protein [Arthrobacter sp. zg-Y238]MCQ1951966.1 mannitol dehydrogenase family protein [Arthrobacter sp. zg-Y238]
MTDATLETPNESADGPTTDALPLAVATLPLQSNAVEVPSYDPEKLRAGVVHFGVGGFHRAHQAVYFDEIAAKGLSQDWGIIGVGLHRREMKDVLSSQDNLYTVVERGEDHNHARIVGSIVDYLYAPEDPEAVLTALAAESTRLVTLTVTGTSYHVDAHTGEFLPEDEEIARDLQGDGPPETVFGYLVEGLRRRRAAGIKPFTILSCDNVQENGKTTRTAVVSFARLQEPELADWIEENVCFPSSMVDRITPSTSPEDRDEIAEEFGVEDGWPVLTEPFRQWIIEDKFCNERPPLDQVGAKLVQDVEPFELMKTRLLNGSHCGLGYFGSLLGHSSSDEAMRDDEIRAYVRGLMGEIIPLLPDVPGMDLADYRETLISRFSNPEISDQLERLARRSSTKMPSYVLPSLKEALAAGSEHRLLVLTVAGWIEFLGGEDLNGNPIDVQDALLEDLRPVAANKDVAAFAADESIFGELADDARFIAELQEAVDSLRTRGPRETIKQSLKVERN